MVLGGLNNIKIPKWVPGVGGKGFSIAKIPYLAEGGHMINGQAIVGEAGPELLTAKMARLQSHHFHKTKSAWNWWCVKRQFYC